MTGCLMCGGEVEFEDFTSLCNACEDANLRYAEEHPCEPAEPIDPLDK